MLLAISYIRRVYISDMNLPSEVFYIQNKISVLVQIFRNTIFKCVRSNARGGRVPVACYLLLYDLSFLNNLCACGDPG